MGKAELKQEFRKLPFPDRVELLEELWHEAETEQPALFDWQKEILDRRLADAESHPEDWTTWDEARLRLERLVQARG